MDWMDKQKRCQCDRTIFVYRFSFARVLRAIYTYNNIVAQTQYLFIHSRVRDLSQI